jgi:hypothetical protein
LFQCRLRQTWFIATAAAWLEKKISSGDSVKRLHLDGDAVVILVTSHKERFKEKDRTGRDQGSKKGPDSGFLQI